MLDPVLLCSGFSFGRYALLCCRIWHQTPDGQIVDDLFDLLDVVLEAVVFLAQVIILQIQHTESGVQVRHKSGD